MEKLSKSDKVKILTREILFFAADALAAGLYIFDRHQLYRKDINDYFVWRDFDREDFSRKLYRLKQNKMIRIYQDGKRKYLELTPKALKNIELSKLSHFNFKKGKWDKKWRIVIFDIPNEKKDRRDSFRARLHNWGFYQLQESVFIFPFECRSEINFVCRNLFIEQYVKYIVVDFFQDDERIIRKFIKRGLLDQKDFQEDFQR